jgi:GNAT superfamily N-acetyltransferase
MATSIAYNYVRSRQLEGTFPGDRTKGIWPVTAQRVLRGWGAPAEEDWPYQSMASAWPPHEPPGLDAKAKPNRSNHYQRVRSAEECLLALRRVGGFKAAFEITSQWFDAPLGIIEMPEDAEPIVGTHAVQLVPRYLENTGFVFANTWGKRWGNHGFGVLPPEFFDRYLIEAWIRFFPVPSASCIEGQGITALAWRSPDCFGGVLHGVEVVDATHDERIAWSFAVRRDRFLDVEEFFVMPAYRRHGYGTRLADMLRELARELGLNVRLWVPFADCEADNLPGLEHVASKLDLTLMASGVRWAALKAVGHPQSSPIILPMQAGGSDARVADLLTQVSLPERPAKVRAVASTLGAAALATGVSMADCDSQPREMATHTGVAADDAVVQPVHDDELDRCARQALQKYAPLYQRLASSPAETVPERADRVIPDDLFETSAEKALDKYSELYERLS